MKDKTIIMILGIICICATACIISGLHTEKIVETERHYISMKWEKELLLGNNFYFEFDNSTSLLLGSEFKNPSYIYHKYSVGDIIEWNTTSTIVSLKWWK